ncbi:MAG: citrate transporter, partial [Acinetobacter sp.]
PSTYLLCGLAGVEFADHQKFTLKWATITSLVLMGSAILLGVFPFVV